MKPLALIGGLVVLAAVPLWVGSTYYVNVAAQILFYAIFALAVNVLAGYAGWAPMQLENEIRAGAWLPTDVEASIVFDVPADDLWRKAYERIGATPMAFTSRTVGSA